MLTLRLSRSFGSNRPILPSILSYKGTQTHKRNHRYSNDEANRAEVDANKSVLDLQRLLGFANTTLNYREFVFSFPSRGHALLPEQEAFHPVGVWSQEQLMALFDM